MGCTQPPALAHRQVVRLVNQASLVDFSASWRRCSWSACGGAIAAPRRCQCQGKGLLPHSSESTAIPLVSILCAFLSFVPFPFQPLVFA